MPPRNDTFFDTTSTDHAAMCLEILVVARKLAPVAIRSFSVKFGVFYQINGQPEGTAAARPMNRIGCYNYDWFALAICLR